MSGAITWAGDTHPTSITGFPALAGSDADGDGVEDVLFSGGHQIITDGINMTDPTGTVGTGLPWDAQQIWRSYAGPYPVIVGDTGEGSMGIGAGAKWRPTHIGIGWEAGSYGYLSVSGSGSELCNDRDVALTPAVKSIVGLAREEEPSTIVWNHLYQTPAGNPFDHFILQPPGHYNCWVGRKGRGTLYINGASVTIDHRLFVGCYETVDDGGTAPYLYYFDPENPIVKAMEINGVGDLETLVHGEGGVLIMDSAILSVSGLTPQDDEPFPPPKTDGTTEENDRQNQYFNDGELVPAAALASVIGSHSHVSIAGSTLRVAAGLINYGLIEVRESTAPSVIATPPLPLETPPAVTIANERVIYIREGATLTIDGDLVNNGLIYLASGATIDVTGETTGTGEIRRAPCAPTSLDLTNGEINFREAAALLTSER